MKHPPNPTRLGAWSGHETILLAVVAAEILLFAVAGRNFGTTDNIANVVRLLPPLILEDGQIDRLAAALAELPQ